LGGIGSGGSSNLRAIGSESQAKDAAKRADVKGNGAERMLKLMSGNFGVSAMVRCVLWLEDKLGLETLNIGRQALARKDSCTLEICGAHLFYTVVIDGGFVFVLAQAMDAPAGSLESLLSVGDTPEGWRTICKLIAALERHPVKSLERPIEAGEGRDGFVIG
jgi:hypothetical protein